MPYYDNQQQGYGQQPYQGQRYARQQPQGYGYGQPQGYGQGYGDPYGQRQPRRQGPPPKSGRGMALAATILGAVAIVLPIVAQVALGGGGIAGGVKPGTVFGFLCLVPAVLGIVLGAVSLGRCGRAGESQGLAIAGLVLGIVAVIVDVVVALIA